MIHSQTYPFWRKKASELRKYYELSEDLFFQFCNFDWQKIYL